jgi:REP element-mobilizing transposase RayT
MSQSLSQIYVHLVCSTKLRQPFLADARVREEMFAYLVGSCAHHQCLSIIVGGAEDHVHILCRLAKTVCAADLVRDLKRASSLWIKEAHPELANFLWQNGYGAFSLSPGHVPPVKDYIANQWEHHHSETAGVTYQDEFRRLCERYGLEIDERFCWD